MSVVLSTQSLLLPLPFPAKLKEGMKFMASNPHQQSTTGLLPQLQPLVNARQGHILSHTAAHLEYNQLPP
eukprot:3849340-Amphidinium_carterae.1